MALVIVQEDGGGDYTTLAAAIAANETDIEIQETWSAAEEANLTIDDNSTTITCTGAAKHPGYVGGAPSHYRIEDDNGGHVFTITGTPVTLDGLDIHQTSAGASDECIRMSNDGGTLTVKNCLLHSDRGAADQDGICWQLLTDVTVNVENCMIYRFDRAGIHPNVYAAVAGSGMTHDLNVNSCTIWDCGENSETLAGGIGVDLEEADLTINVNIFNTWVLACSFDSNDDYNEVRGAGSIAWDIHYCIDSDNSIASRDGAAVGSLASRAIAQTDQGAGNYVIVEDTDSPYDLRLQDLGNAKNNAQDMHAVASGAGMNIPATDIVGTNRPQNTNYDCGAFEVSVVSSSSSSSSVSSSSESSSSSSSSESSSSESSSSSSSSESSSSESSSSSSSSVSSSSESSSSSSSSVSNSSESSSSSSSSISSSSESSSFSSSSVSSSSESSSSSSSSESSSSESSSSSSSSISSSSESSSSSSSSVSSSSESSPSSSSSISSSSESSSSSSSSVSSSSESSSSSSSESSSSSSSSVSSSSQSVSSSSESSSSESSSSQSSCSSSVSSSSSSSTSESSISSSLSSSSTASRSSSSSSSSESSISISNSSSSSSSSCGYCKPICLLEKIKQKLDAANATGGTLEDIKWINWGAMLPPLGSTYFPLIFLTIGESRYPEIRAAQSTEQAYDEIYTVFITVASYVFKNNNEMYKAAFQQCAELLEAVVKICHANEKWDNICFSSHTGEDQTEWRTFPLTGIPGAAAFGVMMPLTCSIHSS